MARRCRLVMPWVCVVVVSAAIGGTAHAQRLDEFRKRQTDNTTEISAAETELRGLENEQRDLERTAQRIAADLDVANQRFAAAAAEAQRYDLAAFVLEAQIETTQRKLDEAKAATRRSAVLLYQGRSGSAALTLLDGDASGEIVEGKQYLEHVSDKRRRDAEVVGVLRAELGRQQAALNEARKRADDARDAAAAEQARVQTLFAQQQHAIDAVKVSEVAYHAKLDALAAQKAQLAADFKAASDEIAAELAAIRTPAYGNGTFVAPIPGAPVVSGFGYRIDPFTGEAAFHAGVDFAAPCGTRIHAAGIGQVISVGENGGYGNLIVVNHGGGLATLYGHQSEFAASPGDVVESGDVIGYVGSTGHSTGCHLHFEVRVSGVPQDPLRYL